MGGVIPEDEEEYDDCLTMNQPTNHSEPIDDDIYEELPGLLSISYFLVYCTYCYLLLLMLIISYSHVNPLRVVPVCNVVENGYRNFEFGVLLSALTGTFILSCSEEDIPQPVKPTVTLANKPPPPSTHVKGNYH